MIQLSWFVGSFAISVMLFFVVAIFLLTKARVTGKLVCIFLEKDKSLTIKPLRVDGDFVRAGQEMYKVEPDKVRLFRYPQGWPKILQTLAPSSLYVRGGSDPLGWIELAPAKNAAQEITAALEPHWMAAIVRGAREGVKVTGLEKMLPLLTAAIAGLALLMTFVLMMKIGEVSAAVRTLDEAFKVLPPGVGK